MFSIRNLVVTVLATFCFVLPAHASNLASDLLPESVYRGAVMYSALDDGFSLRELRMYREGDKLRFEMAHDEGAKGLVLDLKEAEQGLQNYPFGLPDGVAPRAQLKHLSWKITEELPKDSLRGMHTVHLFFKTDDLLEEEGKYMPNFMPPLQRVLVRFDATEYSSLLDGGMYSESEIERGDWEKALKILSPNYEILVFNGRGGCETILKNDKK